MSTADISIHSTIQYKLYNVYPVGNSVEVGGTSFPSVVCFEINGGTHRTCSLFTSNIILIKSNHQNVN